MDTLLRFVGVDLQHQLARLRAQAEDFKNRTIDEVKHQVAQTGITIGLAVAGAIFVLWTVVIGLIALYLWVEMWHGPFVALGVVGLTTAIAAALLFAVAASRGGSRPVRAARVRAVEAESIAPAVTRDIPVPPNVSLVDALTHQLTSRATSAANEALDSAAELVRKGPREAILAALAVAAVIGIVVGRRRR